MSGANETVSLSLIANMDISQVLGGVKAIQNGFNGLKIDPKIMGDLTKEFSNLQGYVKEFQKIMGKENVSKTDIKNLQNLEKSINSSFSNVIKLQQQLNGSQIMSKVDSSQLDELVRKTEAARAALNDAFSNIKFGENSGILQLESGIEKAVGRSKTLKTAFADAFADLKTGNVDQFVSKIDGAFNNLEGKLKNGKLETTAQGLIKTFQQLGLINIDVKTDTAKQKIDALKLGFEGIKTAIANGASGNEIQQLIQNLEKATNEENEFRQVALQNGQISMGGLAEDTNKVAAGARDAAKAEREFQAASLSATQQVQQLQQSAQYFFSLRNMINLLKQGLKEAVSTVKELDAAMTETAVVTDFSVSDMWKKLPEYTANANALGATVKDMYESTTLYYQQGLNTEQSMSIASETMKMARIAGLDAADATDKMTAALRGFNMEINETSAQRINDVYSNLAAKTASNTEELGTAMQRTASIAASAGMSFEGTAAFLAQAIETTREPAENIGTAMKTIIARMQEMKKNPLEIGEVDGEEVNYNKIDAALQSIGISLKAANGDFRDNDEVLLDISQRWDSLTQTQQRYIATSIAGSRQQSRFIAMVSDYERTLELMDYANNAEGASQEQFGKTLDSLEAKLNKFQNAWKKFLMNIMNDSWTKGIVDGATSALNAVTKLIDTLSFEKKGLKSILSLATAFTALKIGGRGINALIGGLGGLVDPKVGLKEGFRTGALGGQANNISSPIVKAIYSLIPHIDKAAANNLQYKGYGDFKGAKQELNKQFNPLSLQKNNGLIGIDDKNKYSLSGIQDIFSKSGINEAQQKALYASYPGLKHNMTKTLAKVLQESGADSETTRGLIAGFKDGSLTSAQVLEKAGLVKSFSTQMKDIGEKSGQEAANAFRRAETKKLVSDGLDKKLVQRGKDLGYSGKDLTNYVRGELDKRVNTKVYASNDRAQEILDTQHTLSKSEQLANGFGRVGGALTSAGMSLQMFGAQISAIHPVIGAVITQLGGLVSALGALPNIVSSIVAGGPVVWGITAAVVALGAAFYKAKKHVDSIKKSADKAVKSFKDTNKQTQDNIASLKTYMTQANYWSQNVDKNGYNVGLGDDEYKQYLDAVDKIAELNPNVVKGYNAQGHAIVDINSALKETIKLEKQRQEEATEEYLKDSTGDKITKARDVNKDFLKVTREMNSAPTGAWRVTNWLGTELIDKNFGTDWFSHAVTPFQKQVGEIVNSLKSEISNPDEFYKQFSIDYNKLLSQDEQEIYRFVKNRNDIYSKALEANGGELSDKITNKFTDLDDLSEKFDAATQDQKEWLNTYVSSLDSFENIPEELKGSVLEGLDHIAIQPNLNFSDMQDQADAMLSTFDNLTREGGDYQKAMEDVTKAQESFASSMDPSEYADKTRKALNSLDKLYQQYAKDTSAYGQAVAEFLQNQIERIEEFPEEGSITLAEALNTHASEVQGAEGAFAAFQESTKSDFATGAENMKSIYDEIVKETDGVQLHLQGGGDNTLWTGMNSLFSKEAVDKAAAGGESAVRSMLDRVEPMLQEGQAGFDAFWTDMFSPERVEALKDIEGLDIDPENWEMKWDEDINPDVFHEMAEALGYSDSFLASMLNKGRQFADLDFMDMSQVRKALSTDEAAIKGTTTTTVTNDKGEQETVTDRYVKEDYLRNALAEAQIVNPQEQNEAIEKMEDEGIKIIPGADSITPKELNNLGIKDMSSAITTLGDTGQFNRNEIEEYAKNLKDFNPEEFGTLYDDYLASQEHPELPTLTSIEGNVATIASIIGSNRVEKGYADESTIAAYEEAKKLVNGENGWRKGKADSISELFALGKNKEGKKLTDAEYKTTSELLDKQIKAYEKQAALAEKGAQKAEEEGRQTDADELSKEAAGYAELARRLLLDKEQGEKNYLEQEKRDKEAADRESKEKDYSDKEKSNWEKTDVTPEEYVKAREEGRKSEQTPETPEQTISTDQVIGEINRLYGGVLSGIDPAAITMNPAAQATLDMLYNNAVNSGTTTLTDGLMTQMQSMGIDIQQAIDSGLVIDSNGIYASAQQESKEGTDALEKGLEEGPSEVDTSTGAEAAADTVKKGVETTVQAAVDAVSSVNVPKPKTPTPETTQPAETQTEPTKYQVDNSEAMSKTQELKDSAQETIDTINTPATMTITTPGAKTLQTAAKDAKKLQGAASGNKNFNVTASVSGTDKIKPFNAAAKEAMGLSSHSVSYTARTSGTRDVLSAVSAGQSFQNLYDKTVTYTTVHKTINKQAGGGLATHAGPMYLARGGMASNPMFKRQGTDTIPTMLTPGEYVQNRSAVQYFGIDFMRKINHKDLAGALQSFGSAAKGRYGHLGPDGKGGLTLTGELGYEIAWIPSENRSMILGANGPQMVNLPEDTVVWTHEQSKKILKQKAIPAGSHSGKAKYIPGSSSGSGNGGGGGGSNNRNNNNNNSNNNGTGSAKDVSNVAAISNIIVWWDNITRRADKTQRKADKNQKDYEKYLKNIQVTLTKTGTEGKGNDFISNINKAKDLYQEQFDRAKTELKNLDRGTKAQRDARKTKSKKDDKTARRKAFNAEAGGAVQISYETGKGSKKKTKNALINTASYIQAKDDTYVINQKKLNRVTKKGGKRKALAEALNKEINDRISKKNTAEDNIRKAREALEQFRATLYETFFAWESELTQIWNITKKIEQAQNRSSRADKYLDLLESQLSAGLEKATSAFNQATISAYQKQLTGQVDTLKAQVSAISANQKAVQKAYSTSDEKTTRDSIQKRLNSNAKIEAAATKKNDAKKKLNAAKADKKKQQAEIKKQNKIINNKDANKAQKAAAKKVLAKAQKQLKKDNENITKYQKRYNTANKNYKNVASSNTALSATEKAGYEEYIKELNNQIKIAGQAQKYLKTTQYADGTMDVEFNSDAFEADKLAGKISKDMAEGIDKYVTGITEAVDELNKAYEDLTSSLTELYKSLEDLRSEYADNADELVKVLDEQNQKELDKLKELNDSLTKALKDLLDEVKKRLDERRRQEDNAKTERDISQKQQRLAMLRADTAGGNQVEIAQLEKEIAEAQQNYQRSLEDQLLDRLQEQGDEAARQRERQIELQETLVQSVNNIPLVESWLSELKTLGHTDKDEARRKELEALMRDAYRSANDYENQGSWRQSIIDTQFQSLFNSLDTFDEKENATVNAINNTKTAIETVTTSIDNLKKTIDENNNSSKTPSTPTQIKSVTPATSAKSATSAKLVTNNNKSTSTGMGAGGGALSGSGGFLQDYNNLLYRRGNKTKTTDKNWGKIGKDALKAQINRGKKLGYSEFRVLQDLADTKALDWGKVLTAYINLKGKKKAAENIKNYFDKSLSDARKNGWKSAFRKNYPEYEYGGLADFTGPAWLDGTQSKPELILNSTDTKNFLALKDVLSHALSSTSSINNSYGGDATFEININVDHINSDYDVDKITERVKRNIVKDSSYRNVTQVRKFR